MALDRPVPRSGRGRRAGPPWRAGGRPGGGRAALDAGRRAQAALPPTALPLERIRVIAAALAAGDELRLELRPAAVTAAARSLIAGLVDCLPHPGPPPAGGGSIAGRLWGGLSTRRPGARSGRGARRRPGAAGRPRAGRVDGGRPGGRLGQGRPVRGRVGRAGHGQRDPPRRGVAGDRGPAGRDRPAGAGGDRGRRPAASWRAPPGLRPPPLPGRRPARRVPPGPAPRHGRRVAPHGGGRRPPARPPPAGACPSRTSTSPWPPSPTSPP